MRLRPELGVGETSIYDPLFHRHFQLGEPEMAALRKLPEISDEKLLRRCLHLNLIEGAGGDVIERARRLKSGKQKLPRVILGEARFQCAGSGDCCQSYSFGPLSDADMAKIEPLAAQLGKDDWWYKRGDNRYLRTTASRCCFLDDDCRCSLHAKFGPEAKPDLCQFYPYAQLATLWGIQYYDKGHCSQFATTARSGPPLAEWIDQLTTLMGDPQGLYHPLVLLGESPIDYGYFNPLLEAMIEDLEQPPATATRMLRAWARRTRALAEALAQCPLSPEGPSLALQEVLARGVEPFLFDNHEAVAAGARSLGRIARKLVNVSLLPITSEDHYSGRHSRELIPVLQLLDEITAGEPLSDYAREVCAVSAEDADADDVLRLSLRNQLFGRDSLVNGRVEAAQLRLALVQILSLWGARLRALADGRSRITSGDLTRCHMLAMRVTSWTAARNLFVEEEACTAALVEALPELAHFSARSATMRE